MIRALARPYGQMEFMPTGGIGKENIREYLSYDKNSCLRRYLMVPPDLIREGNFAKIRELTEEAVHAMLDFRLADVGINCADETQAKKTAETFEQLFGFGAEENPSSIFSGKLCGKSEDAVSWNKRAYCGRSLFCGKRQGISGAQGCGISGRKARFTGRMGKMQALYLKEEIGGFAVHLVRNPETCEEVRQRWEM